VPTLLVNGTWEKRFQPMREAAAKAIPGVTVVDLPAGHSVNIEAAEGFDAAVKAFVERVSG
jgi:pimeloyl-ACP methyl ester carboxylesterase